VAALATDHTLLGFGQPASLNRWPVRDAAGNELQIAPKLIASSGETLRQLALAGVGIVCLADFLTRNDRAAGTLVQVLPRETLDVRQPVHAVYYRNTQLSARIACFLNFMSGQLTQEEGSS
jgi:DNA-binding transcriptional LysR family regulator